MTGFPRKRSLWGRKIYINAKVYHVSICPVLLDSLADSVLSMLLVK